MTTNDESGAGMESNKWAGFSDLELTMAADVLRTYAPRVIAQGALAVANGMAGEYPKGTLEEVTGIFLRLELSAQEELFARGLASEPSIDGSDIDELIEAIAAGKVQLPSAAAADGSLN